MDFCLSAARVVTMEGCVWEPGWIQVQGDRIAELGPGLGPATAVALGDWVLMPGLVNAHCHLDYTRFRGRLTGEGRFTDWIVRINGMKRQCGPQEFEVGIREGFEELIRFGTTSVVNVECVASLAEALAPEAPIRTWWAIEGIDLGRRFVMPERLPELKALSPHAPFTASPGLYREAARRAAAEGALVTTHVAESQCEAQMFREAAGPLFELVRGFGRAMEDCGRVGALRRVLDDVLLGEATLLVHVNHVEPGDLERAAEARHAMVHCGQTHEYFGRGRFDWERYERAGIPVYLGTDSLASAWSLSLFEEMRRACAGGVSAEGAVRKATVEPGTFLARWAGERLGVLRRGGVADLIAIPRAEASVYEGIVGHRGAVPLVVAGGRVLRDERGLMRGP